MFRWRVPTLRKFKMAWQDRRGAAAFMFVVAATAVIGATGFAVDVGTVLIARQALQANTNAAVLDGAYVWTQSGGTQANALTAAQGWITSHSVPFVSSVTSTATAACVTSTTNLPPCVAGTSTNAISLKQTGTVPTFFLRVLGKTSWTVSAEATAAKGGGAPLPLNVMFVLDTTRSMGTSADSDGCTVPGVGNPTKLQCAMYGVQQVLKQLDPSVDKVGLMVFPGMSSTWTPCGTPNIVPYGATGITYQLIHNALDTNYATSIGVLNDSSALVKTVGDNKTSGGLTGCLQAPGGEGTFYADAISAAQSALKSEGAATAQNVIILLSDGEANATSSDMASGYATTACAAGSADCSPGHLEQQCNQAVYNATSATNSGTWVFAIAYDTTTATAGTSSSAACPTQMLTKYYYDSPTGANTAAWSPCSALQSVASSSANFYSTQSSCKSVNSYADVATMFRQVGQSLMKPRRVLY